MKLQKVESDKPDVAEPKDPLRRRLAKDSLLKHIVSYHGDTSFQRGSLECGFYDPTQAHLDFIQVIDDAVHFQSQVNIARAFFRGFGKTSIGLWTTEWAVVHGLKFRPSWFCANEDKCIERAELFGQYLTKNSILIQDFPEICRPLIDQKEINWTGGIRLANGVIPIWSPIDSANLGTIPRPDLIFIDDPDDAAMNVKTGKNVGSITLAKRIERIDKQIGFLGEQGGSTSIFMITTVRSIGGLSYQYCTPKCKPMWSGKIYSAIDFAECDFLDGMDDKSSSMAKRRFFLWSKYVALCGTESLGVPPPDESELGTDDDVLSRISVDKNIYLHPSFLQNRRNALRFFAANKDEMMIGISELDPIRLPVWEFFWKVGSDDRGVEIVWSELQNNPLVDPFTKQMRFTETQLWKHQIVSKFGEIPFGYPNVLCSVVVESDQIYYQCDACTGDFLKRHVFEVGLVQNLGVKEALEFLFQKFQKINPRHVAVDVSSGSGKNRGEWAEIVTHFCVRHRPWFALQDCDEWDEHQAARAMEKNWCVEAISTNPFGVVRWHSVHFKNRLAAAYNKEHPITFFGPDVDDQLHRYIRSQTSEQYTLEFIPDKTAKKSKVEKWVPVPKYRNMTQFWKTAAMIECLADIAQACKPRENRAATLVRATNRIEPQRRRF